MIAHLILPMLVMECFVLTMKLYMGLDARWEAALKTKLIQHRPVNSINENGKSMYRITVGSAYLGLSEC